MKGKFLTGDLSPAPAASESHTMGIFFLPLQALVSHLLNKGVGPYDFYGPFNSSVLEFRLPFPLKLTMKKDSTGCGEKGPLPYTAGGM